MQLENESKSIKSKKKIFEEKNTSLRVALSAITAALYIALGYIYSNLLASLDYNFALLN